MSNILHGEILISSTDCIRSVFLTTGRSRGFKAFPGHQAVVRRSRLIERNVVLFVFHSEGKRRFLSRESTETMRGGEKHFSAFFLFQRQHAQTTAAFQLIKLF